MTGFVNATPNSLARQAAMGPMSARPGSRTNSLFDSAAFRGVLDAVPHPIFVKDAETRFLVVNEMMCRFMNRSFEELVGRNDYDFVPKEQADVFRGNDLRVLNTGEVNENEELFTDSSGELRTIVTKKNRLVLPDGSKLLVGCITDISDFRRVERLVRHNAEHDALTGLPNRRVFSAGMEALIARAAASKSAFAFHLIDLDGFKLVNDVHGHTTGDAVLCAVASRLERIVRAGDLICRLGGDEFAMVGAIEAGDQASDMPERALAERAIAAIEEPIAVGGNVVRISASIGIARCPADGADLDTLLRVADLALYRAKREGRGTFRFFDESMQDDIRDQVALENDLKQAVADGTIVPGYQPIYALGRRDLIGFEML
ncbi:MAG TPA: diguanylate cyclase, partial [Bauldia sp.]|nr:diguanylate cyclase [Bauldia sp.]